MSRKLTKRAARKMNAQRKTHGGGRPKVPTRCPKCGTLCAGSRLAQVHCSA